MCSEKTTFTIKQLRFLVIGTFKNINPNPMKNEILHNDRPTIRDA